MDAKPTANESLPDQPLPIVPDAWFRRVVEDSTDFAFMTFDLRGCFTSWNAGAHQALGYEAAEVLGRSGALIYASENGQSGEEIFAAELQTALQDGHAEASCWFLRRDGSRVYFTNNMTALRDETGTARGFVKIVRDLTQQKQDTDLLRASQLYQEAILQTALDAIVAMDHEGRIVLWNPAAERIFGYSRTEAVGALLADLIVPPALRQQHWHGLEIYLRTGEGTILNQRIEVTALRAGGEEFPVELTIIHFSNDGPPLFIGTVRDITERQHSARALLERAHLAELNAATGRALNGSGDLREMLDHCVRATVEHLDAAFARIWTLDETHNVLELQASAGLYTHLNGAHSRIPVGQFKIGRIAQTRQPHLTNDVLTDALISDQQWARHEGMVAFAGYPLIMEERLIGVIGMFARHSLSKTTLEALATIANSIALGIERKRGEQERSQLLQREQRARQEAENTNRIKDEFLSTLSHELRTPLTSILGWTHMLSSHTLEAEAAAQALQTIERNARAQVQLIEDLLDISRIITGKLRLEVRPLQASEVVMAAVDAVRPAAAAKNIRLQLLLDSHAGPLSGDSDRLQQVFWNLLTNAVKFTPKGGRVQVRLERVASHLEITIRDTGSGIAEDFLPHIFDRFRQADQTSTREHGGLGLGLSIVHHLVELHGGTVRAHNAAAKPNAAFERSDDFERGAVFVVELPLMAVHPSAPVSERRHPTAEALATDEAAFASPQQLNGLRVLIVDDENDTRELLRVILEGGGSQVQTAASTEEAMQILEHWRPDVMVSDIGMPNSDGYDLIGRVRAWEAQRGGRIPAVALTAYARVEDRVRALRAGFQVHVPKPIEPVELLAVVASLATAPTD